MTGARHMNRCSRLCAWLAALAVLPSFSAALAQDYPARPVRRFSRSMNTPSGTAAVE